MSFRVVRKYYEKLKKESITNLMAEDFIGIAFSGIMLILGDKIATKYFLGDYEGVIIGLILLAGLIVFFLGPLFIFKTIRANKIANNLHKLHQADERRKEESSITQAQLRVVDQEITLVMLKQTEIIEKNRRLWVRHQITESQDVLKGQLDREQDFLDQENREKAETEFNIVMNGFKELKAEFLSLRERLAFKKDEITNGNKVITFESQSTKSKESKALDELVVPELNNVLADITKDLKPFEVVKPKPSESDESELDLDKIVD